MKKKATNFAYPTSLSCPINNAHAKTIEVIKTIEKKGVEKNLRRKKYGKEWQ